MAWKSKLKTSIPIFTSTYKFAIPTYSTYTFRLRKIRKEINQLIIPFYIPLLPPHILSFFLKQTHSIGCVFRISCWLIAAKKGKQSSQSKEKICKINSEKTSKGSLTFEKPFVPTCDEKMKVHFITVNRDVEGMEWGEGRGRLRGKLSSGWVGGWQLPKLYTLHISFRFYENNDEDLTDEGNGYSTEKTF